MKKSTRVTATALVATLSLSWLSAFAAEAPKESECDFQNAHPMVSFSENMSENENFPTFFDGRGKFSEMTEEERAAKSEEMKTDLSEKLAAGEITQDEYDKIISSLEDGTFIPNHGHMKEGSKPGNAKEFPENNSDISEE